MVNISGPEVMPPALPDCLSGHLSTIRGKAFDDQIHSRIVSWLPTSSFTAKFLSWRWKSATRTRAVMPWMVKLCYIGCVFQTLKVFEFYTKTPTLNSPTSCRLPTGPALLVIYKLFLSPVSRPQVTAMGPNMGTALIVSNSPLARSTYKIFPIPWEHMKAYFCKSRERIKLFGTAMLEMSFTDAAAGPWEVVGSMAWE